MIKLIGLLKRRAGLSKGEFISYYEENHAPLVKALTPIGADYRRNYVTTARKDGQEVAGEADFDVMTEVWFSDQAGYEAFATAMRDPEIRAKIVGDEEKFIDRAAMRIYVVDERASPAS